MKGICGACPGIRASKLNNNTGNTIIMIIILVPSRFGGTLRVQREMQESFNDLIKVLAPPKKPE